MRDRLHLSSSFKSPRLCQAPQGRASLTHTKVLGGSTAWFVYKAFSFILLLVFNCSFIRSNCFRRILICAGFAGIPPQDQSTPAHAVLRAWRLLQILSCVYGLLESNTDREQINTQELLLLLPISCSREIPAPWTLLSGDSRAGAEGGSGTALTLQPDTVTQTHGLITQFVTLNRNTLGAPGQAAALSWQGQSGDEEPGRVSSS